MFRGFKVNEGIQFERAVKQIEPELSKDYRGTSPRKLVPGTEVSLACCTWDASRRFWLYFLPVCIHCIRTATIFSYSSTFGDVLPFNPAKEHLLLLPCWTIRPGRWDHTVWFQESVWWFGPHNTTEIWRQRGIIAYYIIGLWYSFIGDDSTELPKRLYLNSWPNSVKGMAWDIWHRQERGCRGRV